MVCEGLSPAQCFRVFGAPADLAGLYTIYELNRASEDQYECFFGQDTVAMLHPEKNPFSHVTIMDFCSGMGGFSIGSQLIGMKTLGFVEKSQLACDALRANFSCPLIQGDLGLTSTIKLAHSLKGTNHLQITGGFPCQGFSRQGDMHGMDDTEATASTASCRVLGSCRLMTSCWNVWPQSSISLMPCPTSIPLPVQQTCRSTSSPLTCRGSGQ